MTIHEEITVPLASLAGGSESGVEAQVRGAIDLLEQLLRDERDVRRKWLETPIAIEAAIPGAATVTYPITACWLPAERITEPELAPLAAWMEELDGVLQSRPLLLLARAEGRWDLPSTWDGLQYLLIQSAI